jgi:hypothetical protein
LRALRKKAAGAPTKAFALICVNRGRKAFGNAFMLMQCIVNFEISFPGMPAKKGMVVRGVTGVISPATAIA